MRSLTTSVIVALACCGAACGAPTPIAAPPAPPEPSERIEPAPGPSSEEPEALAPEPVPEPTPRAAAPAPPPFPPARLEPMHERTQKPDDGVWVNLEAFGGGEPSPLMMTELHPDPIRKFVVVAVVALDTSRLGIELVGGTEEPESKAVPRERRTGLVAPEHLPAIVAAYNGGFRARHGSHGMQIAEDEYLPMKDGSCTLLALADGTFAIGTHPLVSPEGKAVRFARQAPACLIEGGALHSELGPTTRKWGAAENGDKEIRRSAMALGPKGELYFAIGDWVTAERLAEALRHLGAESAIQLDINYSFTRFVLFGRKDDGSTVASSPLLKELKFTQSEYVKSPSHRDFFYLWRKDREGSR